MSDSVLQSKVYQAYSGLETPPPVLPEYTLVDGKAIIVPHEIFCRAKAPDGSRCGYKTPFIGNLRTHVSGKHRILLVEPRRGKSSAIENYAIIEFYANVMTAVDEWVEEGQPSDAEPADIPSPNKFAKSAKAMKQERKKADTVVVSSDDEEGAESDESDEEQPFETPQSKTGLTIKLKKSVDHNTPTPPAQPTKLKDKMEQQAKHRPKVPRKKDGSVNMTAARRRAKWKTNKKCYYCCAAKRPACPTMGTNCLLAKNFTDDEGSA